MSALTDISTELTDKFINEPMNLDPTSREVVNTIAPFAVPMISGKVLKTINGDVGGIAKSAKANVDNYVNKVLDPLDLGIPETSGRPYSIAPETSRENGFALQRKGAQFLPQDLLDPLRINKEFVTPKETPAPANAQISPSTSSSFALLKNKISEFYDRVISRTSNEKVTESLGPVSQDNIDAVIQKTGIDLSGYERVIDNYAINHILKKHGNETVEAKRGQEAITREDISRIPEIVESPDDVKAVGKNNQGRLVIRYQKRFDNEIYYVEEVRDGKKKVVPDTMYRRKAGASNAPSEMTQKSLSQTSKTLPGM